MARCERIGAATLYLGRQEDILPGLPRPAAIISDPPYGQRMKVNMGFGRRLEPNLYCGKSIGKNWPALAGDDAPFDPAPLLDAAAIVLLWGAHKFADRLPPGTWLVWDKVPTGKLRDQGDGEAAWLNGPPRALRIFRLLWDGFCVGSTAKHESAPGSPRVHPTQKPECLMAWCIAQARVPAGGTIIDPYMGAGSTGLAALAAGHPFVGIECEPLYFATACRRIEAAQRAAALPLAA